MPPNVSPGLGPLSGKDPSVLILGSFPSVISLEKGEYYANKRNNFWHIMESLFGIDRDLPYDQRIAGLLDMGIALWDVISGCSREGSSDSGIKDVVPNDIPGFLHENPTIKCIALNGFTGAGKWFGRIYGDLPEYPDIAVMVLMSTSPANAGYTYEEKLSDWKKIIGFAGRKD
ncbi:DNA-deoxyinosine glycosylase [Methanolacinia petrolearia]|uniref:DNA-deoxyinosine glycosylase n=1 Tax=Methanolacinia petrolearia TaxID=54120 RepID=UPI003BAD7FCF